MAGRCVGPLADLDLAEVPRYRADPGAGVTFTARNDHGEVTEVAALGVALELIGRLRENGSITGVATRLTPPDGRAREVLIPATAMTGTRLAEKL